MDAFDKYIGRVFDKRYRIEKVIGVGGMAIVFKAEDILMNRTVAIKMLKNDVSGDSEALRRFINESKAVAMLSHENIVNIYDVSVKGNTKYIVMEYIEGVTLKAFLKHKGGILSWRETLNITEQILRALEHAHSKGVIHRDIKPQNILLLKNGLIKVADFGIAKLPDNDTVTATDKAIGTVNYISPEQATNEATIDERSDLYSVGVVMYELSCGKLPFTGDTPVAVAYKHVNEEPVSPRQIKEDMPLGLEQIILRAMAKNPDDRYQSAHQMLVHIAALKKNPDIKFRTAAEAEAARSAGTKKKVPEKKKEKKTQRERGSSVNAIFLGVLCGLLAVLLSIAAYFFMSTNDIDGTSLVIKDYVDRTYDESLRRELQTLGIKVTVVEAGANKDTPYLKIMWQTPEPNTEVKKAVDKELTLGVYYGSDAARLPDFTQRKYNGDVKDKYINEFTLKETLEYSDVVPEGYIIRTNPPAGSEVQPKQQVEFIISKGSGATDQQMPDVRGKTLAVAIQILNDNGFSVGRITYVESKDSKGLVKSQSVAPNTDVPMGTEVNLTVVYGEEETTAEETTKEETTAPETKVPETKPEETNEPETKEPETNAPETKAPETDPPETEAPKTEAEENENPDE